MAATPQEQQQQRSCKMPEEEREEQGSDRGGRLEGGGKGDQEQQQGVRQPDLRRRKSGEGEAWRFREEDQSQGQGPQCTQRQEHLRGRHQDLGRKQAGEERAPQAQTLRQKRQRGTDQGLGQEAQGSGEQGPQTQRQQRQGRLPALSSDTGFCGVRREQGLEQEAQAQGSDEAQGRSTSSAGSEEGEGRTRGKGIARHAGGSWRHCADEGKGDEGGAGRGEGEAAAGDAERILEEGLANPAKVARAGGDDAAEQFEGRSVQQTTPPLLEADQLQRAEESSSRAARASSERASERTPVLPSSEWSTLPPELLLRLFDCLPSARDRASLLATCAPWRHTLGESLRHLALPYPPLALANCRDERALAGVLESASEDSEFLQASILKSLHFFDPRFRGASMLPLRDCTGDTHGQPQAPAQTATAVDCTDRSKALEGTCFSTPSSLDSWFQSTCSLSSDSLTRSRPPPFLPTSSPDSADIWRSERRPTNVHPLELAASATTEGVLSALDLFASLETLHLASAQCYKCGASRFRLTAEVFEKLKKHKGLRSLSIAHRGILTQQGQQSKGEEASCHACTQCCFPDDRLDASLLEGSCVSQGTTPVGRSTVLDASPMLGSPVAAPLSPTSDALTSSSSTRTVPPLSSVTPSLAPVPSPPPLLSPSRAFGQFLQSCTGLVSLHLSVPTRGWAPLPAASAQSLTLLQRLESLHVAPTLFQPHSLEPYTRLPSLASLAVPLQSTASSSLASHWHLPRLSTVTSLELFPVLVKPHGDTDTDLYVEYGPEQDRTRGSSPMFTCDGWWRLPSTISGLQQLKSLKITCDRGLYPPRAPTYPGLGSRTAASTPTLGRTDSGSGSVLHPSTGGPSPSSASALHPNPSEGVACDAPKAWEGLPPTFCFLPSLKALTSLESLTAVGVHTGQNLAVTDDRGGIPDWVRIPDCDVCLELPPSLTSLRLFSECQQVYFPAGLPPSLKKLSATRVTVFAPTGRPPPLQDLSLQMRDFQHMRQRLVLPPTLTSLRLSHPSDPDMRPLLSGLTSLSRLTLQVINGLLYGHQRTVIPAQPALTSLTLTSMCLPYTDNVDSLTSLLSLSLSWNSPYPPRRLPLPMQPASTGSFPVPSSVRHLSLTFPLESLVYLNSVRSLFQNILSLDLTLLPVSTEHETRLRERGDGMRGSGGGGGRERGGGESGSGGRGCGGGIGGGGWGRGRTQHHYHLGAADVSPCLLTSLLGAFRSLEALSVSESASARGGHPFLVSPPPLLKLKALTCVCRQLDLHQGYLPDLEFALIRFPPCPPPPPSHPPPPPPFPVPAAPPSVRNASSGFGRGGLGGEHPGSGGGWAFDRQLRALLGFGKLKWATVCNAPLRESVPEAPRGMVLNTVWCKD